MFQCISKLTGSIEANRFDFHSWIWTISRLPRELEFTACHWRHQRQNLKPGWCDCIDLSLKMEQIYCWKSRTLFLFPVDLTFKRVFNGAYLLPLRLLLADLAAPPRVDGRLQLLQHWPTLGAFLLGRRGSVQGLHGVGAGRDDKQQTEMSLSLVKLNFLPNWRLRVSHWNIV